MLMPDCRELRDNMPCGEFKPMLQKRSATRIRTGLEFWPGGSLLDSTPEYLSQIFIRLIFRESVSPLGGGRSDFSVAHHGEDTGLHCGPNVLSSGDRGQDRLKGAPRLSIRAQRFRGAVFEEPSFLEESFVESFEHGDFRKSAALRTSE